MKETTNQTRRLQNEINVPQEQGITEPPQEPEYVHHEAHPSTSADPATNDPTEGDNTKHQRASLDQDARSGPQHT